MVGGECRGYRTTRSLAYASIGVAVALTMFHWDTPLALEEHASSSACYAPSAWLCPWAADAFETRILRELGAPDLGEYWLTVNEPQNSWLRRWRVCPWPLTIVVLRATVEPYVACTSSSRMQRPFARGNARARREACGIVLSGDWRQPFTDSAADAAATLRALEWEAPLFMDPIRPADGPRLSSPQSVSAFTRRRAANGRGRRKTSLVHLDEYSSSIRTRQAG